MKYFFGILLLVVAVAQLSSGACYPLTSSCSSCSRPVLLRHVEYSAPVRCSSCVSCPMGYKYDGCKGCVPDCACNVEVVGRY
ncbi:AGAP006555-PA-like protein [Anopheles sinensis]|uniref:AGAP006555-PA-like protein n=1 Tax=Anopheles sinensis TaxID=74873 RepID=A0A084WMP8_ANOSI|nr:AGAP006555-PA-like protein [Anopheles sinensis]